MYDRLLCRTDGQGSTLLYTYVEQMRLVTAAAGSSFLYHYIPGVNLHYLHAFSVMRLLALIMAENRAYFLSSHVCCIFNGLNEERITKRKNEITRSLSLFGIPIELIECSVINELKKKKVLDLRFGHTSPATQ